MKEEAKSPTLLFFVRELEVGVGGRGGGEEEEESLVVAYNVLKLSDGEGGVG